MRAQVFFLWGQAARGGATQVLHPFSTLSTPVGFLHLESLLTLHPSCELFCLVVLRFTGDGRLQKRRWLCFLTRT